MSRLIVRNLPTYLTDARLREHFSTRGAVTDVKLMRRPDGTSRKFGFVGFRSEEEAQQALDYFNRTFIDTSRITVEHAKSIGNEELAKQKEDRRARRNGVDAQASSVEEVGKKRKGKDEEEKEGGKKKKKKGGAISFEEFMTVMQPKAKRKAWQNEDALPEQTLEDISAGVERVEKKAAKKAKKKAEAEAAAAAEAAATADQADAEESEAEPDVAANDIGLTDEEYMRLRMKHKVGTDLDAGPDSEVGPSFEQSDDEASPAAADSSSDSDDEEVDEDLERRQAAQRKKAAEAAEKDEKLVDQIMESGRLFVRNLPFSAGEEDIQGFFESFGTVKQVSFG